MTKVLDILQTQASGTGSAVPRTAVSVKLDPSQDLQQRIDLQVVLGVVVLQQTDYCY